MKKLDDQIDELDELEEEVEDRRELDQDIEYFMNEFKT